MPGGQGRGKIASMNNVKLTRERLQNRTDDGSWKRGVGYHEGGRVFDLAMDGQTVFAHVMGTHRYKVELWAEQDRILGDCTCPMGEGGVFCKHCVAAGLQCIEDCITELGEDGSVRLEQSKGKKRKDRKVTKFDDIRMYLREMDTEKLVEIVVEQAKADDRLLRRLSTESAESHGKRPDSEKFKMAIRNACSSYDFVEYSETWDFASGIDDVVDEIAELLGKGYADLVVELSEYAIEEVENALSYTDDSDGTLGMILYRLGELHLEACLTAQPDPRELARRLFHYDLSSNVDIFSEAVKIYFDVLGDEGVNEYRRLAEEEWGRLPALGPGDERSFDGSRFALTRNMESLAEISGDWEYLVKVKKHDLSHPYNYLQIAELYKKGRQYNKAMEWAEKGLEAFPKNQDSRLRSFLAAEYSRRHRNDEAIDMVWENYTERPGAETYAELKQHAEKADVWLEWRKRAIGYLEDKAESEKSHPSRRTDRWRRTWSGDTLVGIYLWEKDIETAWQTARQYGCSRNQWLSLAQLREENHPRDAVEVYQCEVGHQVERTKNDAYREAMKLVRRIWKIMEGMGEQGEFERYVSSLRKVYKRKRNFMGMLKELESR